MLKITHQSSGTSQPCWLTRERSLIYEPLTKNTSVDVAIVRAGIAGLSSAYELNRRGFSVAIFEDGLIGSGESGRTSAHLSSYIDYGFTQIKKNFGMASTKLATESHA